MSAQEANRTGSEARGDAASTSWYSQRTAFFRTAILVGNGHRRSSTAGARGPVHGGDVPIGALSRVQRPQLTETWRDTRLRV